MNDLQCALCMRFVKLAAAYFSSHYSFMIYFFIIMKSCEIVIRFIVKCVCVCSHLKIATMADRIHINIALNGSHQ